MILSGRSWGSRFVMTQSATASKTARYHGRCYTTYPRVSSDPDLVEKLRAVNGLRERAYGNPVR